MIKRSTWIILAIFVVALAAGWYFGFSPYKPEVNQGTAAPTAIPSMLNGMKDTDITRVEIKTGEGEQVLLTKNPSGQWVFAQTPDKPVDQGKVEELLTQLTGAETITALGTSTNLETLGLTASNTRISVTDGQGTQKTIQIGGATAIGSGYYVVVNGNPPIVVSKGSVDSILELSSAQALSVATPTPEISETPVSEPGAATPTP